MYWGENIKLSVFGSSHGEYVGATAWGIPSGIEVDFSRLEDFMSRRAPGQGRFTTSRREGDKPVFEGGFEGNVTNGEAITVKIYNNDQRPSDYEQLRDIPRPGHADFTARLKYGENVDISGGGMFSGRMTAALCAIGGIALQRLNSLGITVCAHLKSVGEVCDTGFPNDNFSAEDFIKEPKGKTLPVFSDEAGGKMAQALELARSEGDSLGGVIECGITGLPTGLGGALFQGIEGRIASLCFAVPGVKGVQFGSGFEGARRRGSENNDPYGIVDGKIIPLSNNAGGILGGISSGLPVVFTVAMKPTPSIQREQRSVSYSKNKEVAISVGGRHDVCIAIRAVPVIEAVAAIALLDIMEDEREHDRA